MKAEGIKVIGNIVTNAIKSSSKSEAVAKETVKGGERLMAAGQDAAAVQGRAMVKPYVKPQMTEVKMEKQNLKAASGGGYDQGGDIDPTPDRGSSSIWGEDGARSHDLWEEW